MQQALAHALYIYYLWYLVAIISSVESLSHDRLFAIPWTAASQASMSLTNSQSLLKLMSIESVMPSNHIILCRPLFLPPSIFPSIRSFRMIQLFTSGGQNIGVSALTSVLPMIFRTDFFWDGLVGSHCSPRDSLKSSPTPQFKSHQFFSAQLSL